LNKSINELWAVFLTFFPKPTDFKFHYQFEFLHLAQAPRLKSKILLNCCIHPIFIRDKVVMMALKAHFEGCLSKYTAKCFKVCHYRFMLSSGRYDYR